VAGRNVGAVRILSDSVGAEPRAVSRANLDVDLVLIAVSDWAIGAVTEELPKGPAFREAPIVAHMAGALRPSVIRSPYRAGKLHPIASLAGGPARVRGVAWGIEGPPDVRTVLGNMVARLAGIPIDTSNTDLLTYHLSAVFGANLLVGLMSLAAELWNESGASAPAAHALIPLARTVLDTWESMGLDAALTGPIARGDVGAIERQLAALSDGKEVVETVYRALGRAANEVAMRTGKTPPNTAEIGRLLSGVKVID